mmetsp:Transcript_27966/g.87114  ORF Transcript_27966/g.87114 Transcript_27966/m.87114 type:complete len:160 (-) Transcript_27966:50-529(-)
MMRTAGWKFISRAGQEMRVPQQLVPQQARKAGAPPLKPLGDFGGPFFLVGSWDGFNGLEEMRPTSPEEPLVYARVAMQQAPCVAEFQVLEKRSWQHRFHPAADPDDNGVQGPDDGQGLCWEADIPVGCRWLEVAWDPRGFRRVTWKCLAPSGAEVLPND